MRDVWSEEARVLSLYEASDSFINQTVEAFLNRKSDRQLSTEAEVLGFKNFFSSCQEEKSIFPANQNVLSRILLHQ